MQYYIGKNGQQIGPFSETELQSKLASGEITGTDMAWREGMPSWLPLSQVLGPVPGRVAPPVNPYAAPSGLGGNSAYAAGPSGELASIWLRLAAVLIDSVIGFLTIIPIFPFYMQLIKSSVNVERSGGQMSEAEMQTMLQSSSTGFIITGVLVLVLIIVQIYLLSTKGQTLGKKFLGIRISRFQDEGNPGFVKAILLRGLVPGLIGAIPILGLVFTIVNICFIFRGDRRCIHDLIADTHVVVAKG